MPRRLSILFVLAVAAFPFTATGKSHSTSTSRQFIIYGADVRVRGAIGDLAETTKAKLLKFLQLHDNWQTPLVINLDFPQANLPEIPASRFDLSQSGSGLKLQLDLLLTGDLNARNVQRELLRAILIEMTYRARTNIAPGSRYVLPPDWLIDGILQMMPGRESDRAAQLFRTLVSNGKVAPLEQIVQERRDLLEPSSQKVHDAYSRALVELLVDSPDGPKKLAQYLVDLPDAPNDVFADLRAHFPAVLGRSAEKWWLLSVARLSATDRYEMLSVPETAQRLDQLLHLSVPGPDGKPHEYGLNDYAIFLNLPAGRASMQQLSQAFLLLAVRAHPSYRAIVLEYGDVVALLARGNTRKVSERLARVANYRSVVADQGRSMVDYMNWYEATQLNRMSGEFTEVLKSGHSAETPPRRRDPVSVYLDSIEAQLQ